jgi:hypothetical protein
VAWPSVILHAVLDVFTTEYSEVPRIYVLRVYRYVVWNC